MASRGAGDDRRRLSRRQFAIAAGLHLVVAFALLHNAWAAPSSSVVGPTVIPSPRYGAGIPNGDSLQLVWFMKWTQFATSHLHNPLLTTYVNSPSGANLMWDALMPLAGLLLSPVTLLAGPVVSFNLLATLAVALCGLAGTACARRFARSAVAAVVGGVAFECSPFVVAQSQGHQSIVLAAAFVPCVLLLVVDVIDRRRSVVPGGVLLGLAAAAAFYTWEETLLSTAVMAVIGLALASLIAARRLRSSWRSVGAFLAVAGGLAVLLTLPGLVIQFAGPMHIAGGAIRPADVWVIDLQNLVTPTSAQVVAPPAAVAASNLWTANSFEWGGYIGVPLLIAVVVVTVAQWRRRAVRWLSAMLVIAVVLSLGSSLHVGGTDVGIPLPWAVFARIPLVQDILAARLAVFPALAASLLLAIAVDALLIRHRHVAAALTVAVVGITLLPAALPAQAVSTPAFFTDGAVNRIAPGSDVLVAPYATPLFAQPMIWQAFSDMRFEMPEGYVSLPGAGGRFLESPAPTVTSATMESVEAGQGIVLDDALRQSIRADLRRWGVHTVIVGPMPHEAEMIHLFDDVLGATPDRVGGVAVWWTALS